MPVVVIIGPTGCGKSSYTREIIRQADEFASVVAGDIARAIGTDGKAGEAMRNGELHPAEDQLCAKVMEQMKGYLAEDKIVILDGFPRSESQAQFLMTNSIQPVVVLQIVTEEDILRQRLHTRARDEFDTDIEAVNKRIDKDTDRCKDTLKFMHEIFKAASTFTGKGTIYLTLEEKRPWVSFLHDSLKAEPINAGIPKIATMIRQEITSQIRKLGRPDYIAEEEAKKIEEVKDTENVVLGGPVEDEPNEEVEGLGGPVADEEVVTNAETHPYEENGHHTDEEVDDNKTDKTEEKIDDAQTNVD